MEETSAIAMDRLRQYLGEGKSAVVDDTFSRRFLRDRCKAVALGIWCRVYDRLRGYSD
jgi:predicted kinase